MPQTPLAIRDFSPGDSAGSYANFAATTTGTLVKTGPGTFLGINVNTAGTGGANVMTIYDGISTAGNIIGVFPTTPVAVFNSSPVSFTVGLFVVLTATTLSGNITVLYL